MRTFEGNLVADKAWRFSIVASRFNSVVVDSLVQGAVGALKQHGVLDDQLMLVRVPGAWELGWAARQLHERGQSDAIIALGAVIRGSTPHFDYVAGGAASALGSLTALGQIVTFGVLTTDTMEQAVDRAGGKAGNKGADAALTALELLSLRAQLRA
jgi:6,7-dimethyl-8-ribityllumazine synthase